MRTRCISRRPRCTWAGARSRPRHRSIVEEINDPCETGIDLEIDHREVQVWAGSATPRSCITSSTTSFDTSSAPTTSRGGVVISTGTCLSSGLPFTYDGDTVSIAIEGLGTLRSPVVGDKAKVRTWVGTVGFGRRAVYLDELARATPADHRRRPQVPPTAAAYHEEQPQGSATPRRLHPAFLRLLRLALGGRDALGAGASAAARPRRLPSVEIVEVVDGARRRPIWPSRRRISTSIGTGNGRTAGAGRSPWPPSYATGPVHPPTSGSTAGPRRSRRWQTG